MLSDDDQSTIIVDSPSDIEEAIIGIEVEEQIQLPVRMPELLTYTPDDYANGRFFTTFPDYEVPAEVRYTPLENMGSRVLAKIRKVLVSLDGPRHQGWKQLQLAIADIPDDVHHLRDERHLRHLCSVVQTVTVGIANTYYKLTKPIERDPEQAAAMGERFITFDVVARACIAVYDLYGQPRIEALRNESAGSHDNLRKYLRKLASIVGEIDRLAGSFIWSMVTLRHFELEALDVRAWIGLRQLSYRHAIEVQARGCITLRKTIMRADEFVMDEERKAALSMYEAQDEFIRYWGRYPPDMRIGQYPNMPRQNAIMDMDDE